MTAPAKVAVLTGAAGGLGRAMLAGLAASGWAVVGIDRDEAALASACDAVRADHPAARLAALPGDLADADAVPALIVAARVPFGPVQALVNNAGLGLDRIRRDFMQRPIAFWEVEPGLVRQFFAVNGLVPFLLAQALAPEMMANGFGRIVNVTTSLDSMIRRGFAPYGGTKASLEAHTAIMAADLEGTGVTANVLVPGGPADTPMIPADTGFARERLIPPQAMVPPLLWLLSDAAEDVTGRRVLAARWDPARNGRAALADAAGPAAWPQLGAQTQWPADPAEHSSDQEIEP